LKLLKPEHFLSVAVIGRNLIEGGGDPIDGAANAAREMVRFLEGSG